MGIEVGVVHEDGVYRLSVDEAEICGWLDFRSRAVAQAVLDFLVEFNPYAFVPAPDRIDRIVVGPTVPVELEPATPALTPEQEARMAAADPPEPIEVLNVEKERAP